MFIFILYILVSLDVLKLIMIVKREALIYAVLYINLYIDLLIFKIFTVSLVCELTSDMICVDFLISVRENYKCWHTRLHYFYAFNEYFRY